MLCKTVSRSGSGITASNQFAWYPWGRGYENQEDLERRNIRQWLNDNLPPQEACGWIGYLRNNWRPRTSDFLSLVSTCHTIELVQLLYPRFPHLFLASHMYSLSPMLFTDLCQPPLHVGGAAELRTFPNGSFQCCLPLRPHRLGGLSGSSSGTRRRPRRHGRAGELELYPTPQRLDPAGDPHGLRPAVRQ